MGYSRNWCFFPWKNPCVIWHWAGHQLWRLMSLICKFLLSKFERLFVQHCTYRSVFPSEEALWMERTPFCTEATSSSSRKITLSVKMVLCPWLIHHITIWITITRNFRHQWIIKFISKPCSCARWLHWHQKRRSTRRRRRALTAKSRRCSRRRNPPWSSEWMKVTWSHLSLSTLLTVHLRTCFKHKFLSIWHLKPAKTQVKFLSIKFTPNLPGMVG